MPIVVLCETCRTSQGDGTCPACQELARKRELDKQWKALLDRRKAKREAVDASQQRIAKVGKRRSVGKLRNPEPELNSLPPSADPMRRAAPRPQRNAPCLCGSGKKFKNCCLEGAPVAP